MAGQQIIGQSLEGTDMKVIQICRGGDCDNGKPDMYIEGGIHARQEAVRGLLFRGKYANHDLLSNISSPI